MQPCSHARRDLHLEDSSNWRCPPGCQHCFNMGRPTHLIPRTPSVIGPPMRTPLVPDVRPSPASCKVLNQKFTKHRSWSKWQRDYERQGGTWPYSSSKWQDLSLGGWEILCASSWWKKCLFICHSNTCSIGTSFYFMWCVCMLWVILLVFNNACNFGFCLVLILWMACDANQQCIIHTQQGVTLSWWQEIWLWGLNMYMILYRSKSDDDKYISGHLS